MIKNFLRDESGASAAEYALILAVVGAVIAASALALSGAVNTSIVNATDAVNTANGLGGGGGGTTP